MKILFSKLSIHYNLIVKLSMILAAAVVIVYIFPHTQKFNYGFQKGKNWHYSNLLAPFDFAILKSEDELKQQRMNVAQNTPVCFKMKMGIAEEQINSFEDGAKISLEGRKNLSFRKQAPYRESELHIKRSSELLHSIFSAGISGEVASNASTLILFKNNSAEEIPATKIYSISSAKILIENETKNWKTELSSDLISQLKNHVKENIFKDDVLSKNLLEDNLAKVSLTKGKINSGEIIIKNGEVVNEETFDILNSIKKEFELRNPETNRLAMFTGNLLLTLVALSLLFVFLFLFRNEVFSENKKVLFFLLFITLMAFMYNWALKSKHINEYVIPLCIFPIIIRTFFDTRVALFAYSVLLLILGLIAPNGFEFIFIQLSSGMVAIFSIVNLRNRSQFFVTSTLIFLTTGITFISLSMVQHGNLAEVEFENLTWIAGNALLTLLAYPLIFFTEKIFGFVSDVSLLELSDSNSPLLRELASKAPGTFQHSLQVSNLAEAAIYSIGGNPLIVRAGAMYHDIGKITMPSYFIENQISSINPHDEISFEESASIIIGHVINGIEIAKKNNLPEQLIDFIRTHHGTTMVQYFYRSFIKSFPDEIVDEKKFRYPGPLPYSRETAVLMMADSVEASARSLKNPDEKQIEELVDKVIDNLVKENQFHNCNITFRDVSSIKKIFRKMLTSIHHSRIEYPR